MARIIFTVTKAMETDLKGEAKRRHMPVAALIRLFIEEGLKASVPADETRDYEVGWGGRRDDENPQT